MIVVDTEKMVSEIGGFVENFWRGKTWNGRERPFYLKDVNWIETVSSDQVEWLPYEVTILNYFQLTEVELIDYVLSDFTPWKAGTVRGISNDFVKVVMIEVSGNSKAFV